MATKLFMRWSDGAKIAIPFETLCSNDVNDALTEFRRNSSDNAHLHVFVPHSAGGQWYDPIHQTHIVAPGARDQLRVRPHAASVLRSGLLSEAIMVFDAGDIDMIMDCARKTLHMWGTGDQDYTACAMRGSLEILRSDLIANIRRAADDDLVPSDVEKNDPAKLRILAYRYGLGRDYDRAYPTEDVVSCVQGARTIGVQS